MGKQETLDGAKGGDGTTSLELQSTFRRLQKRCMSRVMSLVSAAPNILSSADVKVYERDVFSEEALAISGKITIEDKIKALQENLDRFLPEMERQVPLLERKFRSQIENAISQKWIGRRSVARWMQRLAADNAYYYQKKVFIEDSEKFPKFLKNWEKVATERKKLLEHSLMKKMSSKEVKHLSLFLNEENFLNRPYEERENLVAAVRSALTAKERQMPELHATAKAMLEGAARRRDLSWNKVGVWLDRIFKSGASCEIIEQFIHGSGATIAGEKMSLTRLIANWSEASTHFRVIENKRQNKGTPRGFHFVKMEVFLNWRYEQRKAYLNEAENSFEKLGSQGEYVLKIRHELAAQDWDSAEDLLNEAMRKPMTEEQKGKLESLRKFLREHREDGPKRKEGEKSSPQEIIGKLNFFIDHMIPESLREMYRGALADGYQAFWSFTVLMYNRVWCHQHGFYDEAKEIEMEKQNKDPTRKRAKEGHSKLVEWNIIKDDTACKEAIRDQEGLNKAQVTTMDPRDAESRAALRERNRQRCNAREWWYWTSIIPQGVRYAEHLQVVQAIHPQMKKLARQLQATGVRFPACGELAMPSSLMEKQSGKTHQHASEALLATQA